VESRWPSSIAISEINLLPEYNVTGTRHKMRKAVLQAVYAWLLECDAPDDVLSATLMRWQVDEDDAERGRLLLGSVLENHVRLQQLLSGALENWSVDRVGSVEQSIIYLIVQEMITFPDVPIQVLIDEAIRLAKEFAGDESAQFINGILDALAGTVRTEQTTIEPRP
jgi:N utilization substance protein B